MSDDITKELYEALREIHRPHLLFCVHFSDAGWLWEEAEFIQHGGFPWTTDKDVSELMLGEYRDRLDALVRGREEDGLALGTIPVWMGRSEEDPVWEADFSQAYIWPLEEGEPRAYTAKARAALAAYEARWEEEG